MHPNSCPNPSCCPKAAHLCFCLSRAPLLKHFVPRQPVAPPLAPHASSSPSARRPARHVTPPRTPPCLPPAHCLLLSNLRPLPCGGLRLVSDPETSAVHHLANLLQGQDSALKVQTSVSHRQRGLSVPLKGVIATEKNNGRHVASDLAVVHGRRSSPASEVNWLVLRAL